MLVVIATYSKVNDLNYLMRKILKTLIDKLDLNKPYLVQSLFLWPIWNAKEMKKLYVNY